MDVDRAPTPPSRRFSHRSRQSNLSIDVTDMSDIFDTAPREDIATNTIIFAEIDDIEAFSPEKLGNLRSWIESRGPIHVFAPLKSLRRIFVSFYDKSVAERVRADWRDPGTERPDFAGCFAYYGMRVSTDKNPGEQQHLALPQAGKQFLISPPASPPHGWEVRQEDAPNTIVHAEDLVLALHKLQAGGPGADAVAVPASIPSPVSPVDSSSAPTGFRSSGQRSRSSTLIFQPEPASLGNSPDMPCVIVDDMTDEPADMSPLPDTAASKRIIAHTSMPPVELIHDA